jgi:hypothetical protein
MKRRSKSDTIRALADKGLSKTDIAQKTGFSQQLVHHVYTLHKKNLKSKPKPDMESAMVMDLLRKAIKILKR